MKIRPVTPEDHAVLLDIWLRSVRATHTFLTEDDIQFYLPLVRDGLRSGHLEIWVLCSDADESMGFLGMVAARWRRSSSLPSIAGWGADGS